MPGITVNWLRHCGGVVLCRWVQSVVACSAAVLLTGVLACGTCRGAAPAWVDASEYGFDAADATSALQAAIDSGAATVFVPNMGTDWIIRPIFLNSSNQEIIFAEGVVVTAKEGQFHGLTDTLFTARDQDGITLIGYGATLRMHKDDYLGPDYTHSEFRNALRFYSLQQYNGAGTDAAGYGR